MNKWILSFFGVLFITAFSGAAQADIKQKIKEKVEEGIFEEFAGSLAKLPGLEHLVEQVRTNRYQLITKSQKRGKLEIINSKEVKFSVLSRQRNRLGFKLTNQAFLAPGTYWLKAIPRDDKKQAIERKIVIQPNSLYKTELKFWEKGLTTYPLEITAIPASATIRVMNIVPKYEFGMPLRPGSYNIEVSSKNYKTRIFTLKLDHNQNNFGVKLQALSNTKPEVKSTSSETSNTAVEVKSKADKSTTEPAKKEMSTAATVIFWIIFISGIALCLWVIYRLFRLFLSLLRQGWNKVVA